ncbi:MAG TPA: tetratricopeptide repeat protein [Kofleriaceae bacterium]|nr:tetratricopeptide repeat protein [Kofleriaceae bacterium]
MQAPFDSEFDRLLDRARELLGEANDDLLGEAHVAVNQALTLCPNSVDGWLVKCQVASATGDDIAALAAVEMALHRAPVRAECLYWRGAVLGDLGRHREALRAIEAALRVISDDEHWMLEDLYYEKAVILDALGLHDAAVATCETGLRTCPGSPLLRAALVPAERARVRSSLKVLRGGQG